MKLVFPIPILMLALAATPFSRGGGLGPGELSPKAVSIRGELSTADALAQLAKQTGNTVVDRRRTPTKEKIKLDLERTTFWPALEAVARAAGCGFSLYEGEGVALVDRRLRDIPVVHHGIFRLAPREIALVRDEETGAHQCLIDLELAWEPRFKPLYLTVGPMEAAFAPAKQGKALQAKVEGRGKSPVLGKLAGEIRVQLPAPDRSVGALASLKGTLVVMGPSKMLQFKFAALKDNQTATQEEVKVSLTRVKTTADRWSFDVLIENPKDGPVFESFQTYDWLYYNRIALEHKDGKTTWLSDPAENEDVQPASSHRAHFRYHFTKKSGVVPLAAELGNWRLVYETPGRIVEMQVPFTLKNIALP